MSFALKIFQRSPFYHVICAVRFLGSRLEEDVRLERLHDVLLIVELGDVERGLAVEVAEGHGGARVHEKLDDVRATVSGGVVKLALFLFLSTASELALASMSISAHFISP